MREDALHPFFTTHGGATVDNSKGRLQEANNKYNNLGNNVKILGSSRI